MRTTLTLEHDVAVSIDRLRRERELSLKEIVNRALRLGLEHLNRPQPARGRFQTAVADTGRCLLPDVDRVADVLDLVDPDVLA